MGAVQIGTDVGNGKAAAAVKYKNTIETTHFPSIRKKVDRVGFGDDTTTDRYHWSVDSCGQSEDNLTTFVVGDDAMRKSGIIEHDRSVERLGGEFEMFMFMVLLTKLNRMNQRILKKKDRVHMLSCVPPKYLDDTMRERYGDLKGTYKIFLNDDPKPYEYTVTDVDVIEEGRGGMTAFAFDINGRPTSWFEDIVKGRTKLVDLGYKTLDTYDYTNGEISNSSRYDMTTNYGIFPGIVQPLVRELRAKGGDWRFVDEYDIEAAVRAYGQGRHEDCGVWVGENFAPIGKAIMNQASSHANVVKALLESDVATEGMGGVKRLIMIGGGEVLLAPLFSSWYPNKFLRIDKHPATCGIDDASVVINAVGNLIFEIAKGNREVI